MTNPAFLLQITGSLLGAAAQVVNEASSTTDHANRVAYAQGIIKDPMLQARVIAPGVLTNATIASEAGGAAGASGTPVSDSDVDYVVSSLFPVYADYYVAAAANAPTPVFPSPSS